jgi:hypothetical protein
LTGKYALSTESIYVHRLWHFGIQRPSNETHLANFHLFHGSIFVIHPACGNFMLSQTGPELVGAWLQDCRSVEKYQRLLHGLFLALVQYSGRREECALTRQRDAIGAASGNCKEFEQASIDSRCRRCSRGKPTRTIEA